MFEENDARATGRWRGEAGLLATPPGGHFPKQNVGPIKFEIPKIPVIFVLGGPGSGKVTYCDNLIQEKKGITHINMMDLLQQYALGNGSYLLLIYNILTMMYTYMICSSWPYY
ncbi:hypothetical protein ALC62_04022 [Cyphomyrmex costatus]|uniref:Adenylate kinase isoenzyme 5 n=1 Tax=Cyphomyrmex costatus TaxID=456900 RepID=A0A195CY04_9HYME|nr:hypothetical protein ALC62_04022 [Cyphomyrmex costatus]